MPRMDGLSFLSKLMKFHPLPVVVVSSLTPRNRQCHQALELEAVELSLNLIKFVGPRTFSKSGQGSLGSIPRKMANMTVEKEHEEAENHTAYTLPLKTTHKVIGIGASTGGTIAIENVLSRCP